MVVPVVPADEGEIEMLTCEKVLESFWEYFDGEMGKDALSDIKKHLDLCRPCFTRVEFEQRLRDHLRDRTRHACPEKVKKRIQDIIELY